MPLVQLVIRECLPVGALNEEGGLCVRCEMLGLGCGSLGRALAYLAGSPAGHLINDAVHTCNPRLTVGQEDQRIKVIFDYTEF